jgi:hypothetical protein
VDDEFTSLDDDAWGLDVTDVHGEFWTAVQQHLADTPKPTFEWQE